jgi:biopolymer transport protein ExbD
VLDRCGKGAVPENGAWAMTMAQILRNQGRSVDPVDMKDMNTTPLIDVMLVLLIMFIITLPPASHAVKVDLPSCSAKGCNVPPDIMNINQLYVGSDDSLTWNGQAVAMADLVPLLERTQTMSPVPELRLQPDAQARHETVVKVIRATKYAKVHNMGIVGNDAYSDY